MMDLTKDIHSMTTFKRNSSGLMKSMRKTGRPLVLTIKGKAEAVVLDAAAYQEVAEHLGASRASGADLLRRKKGKGALWMKFLTTLNKNPFPKNEIFRHRHA